MISATRVPRVYPILDTASLERLGAEVIEAAEALLEGGAEILQFRHKGFWNRQAFLQAEEIARLCQKANVQFIVNDRADYAAMLNAGLHLGQDDLSPADARRVLGDSLPLGFSTHNADQMCAAQSEPIDYVAIGPIFGTSSKARPDPVVGVEGLRAARELTALPLVAIGGITRENASLCWDAGADAVAIIADLLPTACNERKLCDRMMEWKQLGRR